MKRLRLLSLLLILCFALTTVAVFAAPYYRLGENIEVLWKGTWYPATVIQVVSQHRYKIHYTGYSSSWDEYVSPSRMRKTGYTGGGYTIGQSILVEWHGKWYPATILSATGDGRYKIHYTGYDSSWDEYVTTARMKFTDSGTSYYWKVGDPVMVEWKGTWYPATVLEVRGNGYYYIHYDGYDSSWDEVVGPDRIKSR